MQENASTLLNLYQCFINKWRINDTDNIPNLTDVISESITEFLGKCKCPAIYCYGIHTEMMMADYIFEMRKIKFIIDNYNEDKTGNGFKVIKEKDIEKYRIDGVVISSYKFRDDIKKGMYERHPNIKVLDIYDCLKKHGIFIRCEYYRHNHPYHHYHMINSLQEKVRLKKGDIIQSLRDLINEYIRIKDFRMAEQKADLLFDVTMSERDKELRADLERLKNEEIKAARNLSEDHIIMLCIDGLRRKDLLIETMPMLYKQLAEKACMFENAYSYSTSTYESLIPTYSENYDMRTRYFEKNFVTSNECRFIQKAKKNGRKIHFYTDMVKYIEDDVIQYSPVFETVTQKIWHFLMDAGQENNGFYYLHVLYESHYSFSNPYTQGNLISEGTALLFDYLSKKGGKLRADYEKQHLDAIRYLDDTLAPYIQVLPCQMVLFADHGNAVFSKNTMLSDIHKNYLTCHEDWLRIPLFVISHKEGTKQSSQLISLSQLNSIICCLLDNESLKKTNLPYIKIGRSELYNPDFRYLYKIQHLEHSLLAFEGFIFNNGLKLIIYSDGLVELYTLKDDDVSDRCLIKVLLESVKNDVTVTNLNLLKIK